VGRFRHVADREVFRGRIWTAYVSAFEAPDGSPFEREVVRSTGAVATVPITYAVDDSARRRPLVTLIRQYRPAFDEELIEIPAGIRDIDGEDDAENARRELVEEVGLTAATIEPLGISYQNPGMTNASIAIFLATDCTPVERTPHGPEEEFSEVVTVPLDEAVGWVLDGRVRNSTAIIGLLLAERRLREA
jgi:ADP-ribose pyrophosphatase